MTIRLGPHTAECEWVRQELRKRILDELTLQAEYEARWPGYCRSCNGSGYLYNAGVWRYPDGSGEPPSYEPCAQCISNGYCPRCGASFFEEDDECQECVHCGWQADETPTAPVAELDLRAADLKCICGLIDLYEQPDYWL